jgi:cell division protein FtsB
MRYSHLLSLEAFNALLGIKTGEILFQILAEAFGQFASFDPTQSILFCKFIFEFTRARVVMTPEQTHAAVLAAGLEKSRVQLRAGQQCLGELKIRNEELQRQITEDSSNMVDLPGQPLEQEIEDMLRHFEEEKADWQ